METHTSQKIEYINIGETFREIEQRFSVDPNYRDWKVKKEINIRCPNCTDRKYHLGLSFVKNAYNCYRCSFHGSLISFLKQYKIKYETKNQIYHREMVSAVAPKIKIPIDFNRNEIIANKAKTYMISRGFDLRFIKKNFKIWPITNKYHHYFGYIIVELNDYAFYARNFLDPTLKNQKHIIRKSDKNMKLFYSYNKNNSQTTIICESLFNLMKAAQWGYNAVCIFGKVNCMSFVEYLKTCRENEEICLFFDKDVSIKYIEKFTNRVFKQYKRIPLSYIDPDDMLYNDIADIKTKEELINLINKKKSINDIFLNSMI